MGERLCGLYSPKRLRNTRKLRESRFLLSRLLWLPKQPKVLPRLISRKHGWCFHVLIFHTTTPEDKVAYLKNRLILPRKPSDLQKLVILLISFSSSQELQQKIKQYALSRKAWLAELILDFDTALATEQILQPKTCLKIKGC
jgi:hypothetical protein